MRVHSGGAGVVSGREVVGSGVEVETGAAVVVVVSCGAVEVVVLGSGVLLLVVSVSTVETTAAAVTTVASGRPCKRERVIH